MEKEIYEIQPKPKGYASIALRGLIGTAALGITGFVAFAGISDTAVPESTSLKTQTKVLETTPTPETAAAEAVSEPDPTVTEEAVKIAAETDLPVDASPVASIGTLAGVDDDDDHEDWGEDEDDHEDHERESHDDDDHEDSDHEDD